MTFLNYGNIWIDLATATVWKNGEIVDLQFLSYKLLIFLAHNPGKFFKWEELLLEVWRVRHGSYFQITSKVKDLRRALGADVIETRNGFGWSFALKLQKEGESCKSPY